MKKMHKKYLNLKRGVLPTGFVVGMLITSLLALAFSYRVMQVSTTRESVLAVSPTSNPKPTTKPTAKPSSNPNPTSKPSSNPNPTSKPSSNPNPTSKPSSNPNPTSKPSSNPNPTSKPSSNPNPTSTPGGGGGNNPTSKPTSSVPANQIPNCFNLSGPVQMHVGDTVTYSADFSSAQGQLSGEIFLGNSSNGIVSPPIKHQQLSGDRGSITGATWTPTTADIGTHTVNCRAWNDSIAECRGGNITLDNTTNQFRCAGTNCNGATTSLSIEVFATGATFPTTTATPAVSQGAGSFTPTPTPSGPTPTDPPLPTAVCTAEQISWTKFTGENIYKRETHPISGSDKVVETLELMLAPLTNETALIEVSTDNFATYDTLNQKGDRKYSITLKASQYKQVVTAKVRAKVSKDCNTYSNVISIDVPALIPSATAPASSTTPTGSSSKGVSAAVIGAAAVVLVVGAALAVYFSGN